MLAANARPVKLMFPLVACFLPGLFVVTLGPTIYQFFQFADNVIRSRGLRQPPAPASRFRRIPRKSAVAPL